MRSDNTTVTELRFIADWEIPLMSEQIRLNKAVLIIGPLFGVDRDGKRLHLALRAKLEPAMREIDDDFENVYIGRQKMYKALMNQQFKEFYDEFKPSGVYDQLAKINFSAYVNFSNDPYLVAALERGDHDHTFSYNVNPPVSKNRSVNKIEKPPYVFNVFGSYEDTNSIINGYDTYYEFLFSILGNAKFFPTELTNRIKDAAVVIVVGFDLKKWYAPLILRKILDVGKQKNEVEDTMILTSLNDTDTTNSLYVQWLNRFPLNLTFTKENSYDFIDKLSRNGKNHRLVPQAPENPIVAKNGSAEVLFVQSNPKDAKPTQGGFEFDRMSQILQTKQFKMRLPLNAATIVTLINNLKERPDIVHFAGHGLKSGIVLNDDQNTHVILDNDTMLYIFNTLKEHRLSLVFLNSCESSNQAAIISRYATYVIGMRRAIDDGLATKFAEAFYSFLGKDFPVATEVHFELARAVLKAAHGESADIPEIWKNGKKMDDNAMAI